MDGQFYSVIIYPLYMLMVLRTTFVSIYTVTFKYESVCITEGANSPDISYVL